MDKELKKDSENYNECDDEVKNESESEMDSSSSEDEYLFDMADHYSIIAEICKGLKIVLSHKASKALKGEQVTLEELQSLYQENTLSEYMKKDLHLNPIQRKRIIKYMKEHNTSPNH